MTCHETLTCFHEPFGDAFYYGPERISPTYMHNEAAIKKSGFENSTYDVVLRNIVDHVEVGLVTPATVTCLKFHCPEEKRNTSRPLMFESERQ